ncbi:recombinase family protein [Mesorhizobium sp. M2A.F.Ca.ET.043.02.1.1]|uniref:recombinase family protein n=1 Tax=Mesorhizobium sp. M2A.F.Ca.ET.043.02.1.1 TaxID=2493670 RepID=UPI001FE0C82B|nr:recombinase family protein [Mesorhizobium sp. M2A.F.Ca.ET.043.02.1.1]
MKSNAQTSPKAYSYVRFSTPEQSRGDSKRRQMEKAERYADEHGLDLVDDSYMDLGVSAYRGRNKEAGALADFLQAVKDGVVEKGSYLLVESMDRISRERPRKAVRLLEDICESGIVLVTLGDGKVYTTGILDADPMAFMWAFMVAMRANEESETKAKRVREAWGKKKANAAAEGRPMTMRVPAWLALKADRTGFDVLEDRASVVRRVFREADKGVGQHTIAHGLNRNGVETFGDGKRKAAFWHRSYVAKILGNPAVIGTMIPHETREVGGKRVRDALAPIPNYYPAIIPTAMFNRVNARKNGNNTPRMRATAGEVSNVLAGLASCPMCNSTMTRVNKGRKGGTPYLVCTKAKSGAECQYRQVNLEAVTAAIRHAGGRQLVFEVPSGDEGLDDERAALQAAWDGVSSSIENILTEIEEGNTSVALRRRLSGYEADLAAISEQLETIHERSKRASGRAIAKLVASLEKVLTNPNSTVTEINTTLRDAFARCVVDYRKGSLRFFWKQGGSPTDVHYSVEAEPTV